MSASLLLPRDVTNRGKVGDGVWLIGIVTRRRVRAPATFDNAGKGEKSGKGKGRRAEEVRKKKFHAKVWKCICAAGPLQRM